MLYALEVLLMLGGILLACELFTNAVEHFGEKLNLGHEFTGSILAAVGTALPETILPLVAIYLAATGLASESAGKSDIAIGAIIGAPFMLTTLAMFLLGLSLVVNFKKRQAILGPKGQDAKFLQIDKEHLLRDLRFFMKTFGIAIFATLFSTSYMTHIIDSLCGQVFIYELIYKISGAIPNACMDDLSFALRIIAALSLVIAYIFYLMESYKASKQGAHDDEYDDLPELFMCKIKIPNTMTSVVIQMLIGLGGIIFFAHHFVDAIQHISIIIGIPALVLSLIVCPIATELPEKFNSWMWSSHAKDSLAMGNLSGAMVFQSAIPCSIGVLMTPWTLSPLVIVCAALTMASALILYFSIGLKSKVDKYTLLSCGSLYFVYLFLVFSGIVR